MREYDILTDSACDVEPEVLAKWDVGCIQLTFIFSGDEKEYEGNEIGIKEFYDKMRAGAVAKTSAINVERYKRFFRETLSKGRDVLCLAFSSGLSTTANSARIAAQQLIEEYPDRKIRVVDTLAASAGFGLTVYLAAEQKRAGSDMDEVADYIESIKQNVCHWFTVDDLVYLKRGGRISPAAAFFGNAIGIKPVLHVDSEGHLVKFDKVRGRRSSIMALADKLGERALDKEGGTVFISHGDCEKDAEELAKILNEKYGVTVDLITNIGPIIGAHSGPGTLALFFLGAER